MSCCSAVAFVVSGVNREASRRSNALAWSASALRAAGRASVLLIMPPLMRAAFVLAAEIGPVAPPRGLNAFARFSAKVMYAMAMLASMASLTDFHKQQQVRSTLEC